MLSSTDFLMNVSTMIKWQHLKAISKDVVVSGAKMFCPFNCWTVDFSKSIFITSKWPNAQAIWSGVSPIKKVKNFSYYFEEALFQY